MKTPCQPGGANGCIISSFYGGMILKVSELLPLKDFSFYDNGMCGEMLFVFEVNIDSQIVRVSQIAFISRLPAYMPSCLMFYYWSYSYYYTLLPILLRPILVSLIHCGIPSGPQ